MLGADPGWVELETDQISLFPNESRILRAIITAPEGIPAGSRRIAIQVRELTPPQASTISEVDLFVPPDSRVQLRVDPMAVTGGRSATFSLLVENKGNTIIKGQLDGDDEQAQVQFAFEPERVVLAPGQHAVVDMRAKARRRFFGTLAVRMLSIYLDTPPDDPGYVGYDPDQFQQPRNERDALAKATFLQKSVMSRGVLSLIGLLLAITVFAIVITIALSRLVGQTTADRNLALQVAAARNSTGATGTSGMAGTVTQLTSGKPVAGVAVSVFSATDTDTALATTATDAQGAYRLTNLAGGQYKLSFRGAGFVQLWYPGATSAADATTITLGPNQQQAGLNVRLGGVPASISGQVVGDDVSAATLFLETVPSSGASIVPTSTLQPATITPGVITPPDNGGAVVKIVPIGSDGSFTIANVPSPSVYDLVVTKAGYATSTQRIDIGAGETRNGVIITLSKGDGLISGTVTSQSGPLGGVTLTATSGQTTVNTVSLTDTNVGSFTLRDLPTPATFTVVASLNGFASQTLSISLAAGQKLTGVAITLTGSSGTLTGIVTTLPTGARAPGVSVTVTNGLLTVQTVTDSQESGTSANTIGTWRASGLPLPGQYTITFSRPDLASQTVSVALDAGGNVTPGSLGATITSSGITTALQSATAVVTGTVTQPSGATPCGVGNNLGEATVSLNSGSSTYTVISASVPLASCGQFRLEQIPPGTYTITASAGAGTSPTSRVITVAAGQTLVEPMVLAQRASLSGTVRCCVNPAAPNQGVRAQWTVFLYLESQYPTVVTATRTTDANGNFTFAGIDAGRYILAAGPTTDPTNATNTLQVTVTPSDQHTGVVIKVTQ